MAVRAATWDDLDEVALLIGVDPQFVRSEWEHPSFELDRDAWVAGADGHLVGYAAVTGSQTLFHIAGEVAVADELLARAIARGRERGFGVLRLTDGGMSPMTRRHPFELESDVLLMWRRLDGTEPEPAWPAGIAVRTFQPLDAQAVHALLDAAYCAWDRHYVPMPHDEWVRWMTGDLEFDPTAWWLAERDGELAGCALHWSSGWLKDVAVRPSERGRGIGSALVRQGLAAFARRGTARVGLKVDARNPTGAVRLYERLGFVTERRESTWALSL